MQKPHDWSTYRNARHELIVTVVRVAERLAKTADKVLKPYQLSLAQFNALAVLSQHKKGLPQTKIGDLLVVSRANVTGLMQRMLNLQLIRIEMAKQDARMKIVKLTPIGRRLLQAIEQPYFNEIKRVTQMIKDDQAKLAAKLLNQIQEKL